MFRHPILPACALILALAVLPGCGTREPPAPEKDGTAKGTDKDHGHKPGAHGGTVVHIANDRYHAEPVFEKDGVIRVYMLDRDETQVKEVEALETEGHARLHGDLQSDPVTFQPEPQKGDSPGKTSRFKAQLPERLRGKRVEVTIPAMTIDGNRYRVAFESPAGHASAAMPKKLPREKERELYLTPGGLYTAADIEKNGKKTASEKFADFDAEHDADPKPGDPICPITFTKANPACSWVVGGKSYTFCCPPCIDEFVKRAKVKPESIQAPETYRKK
jgi:YHS domain-containing protein